MRALTLLTLAAALLVDRSARANCAMPVGYGTEVQSQTVVICSESFGMRKCPDADGLLRRAADGSVVRIDACDIQGCFVDECVPPGTYQYGFARPYECASSSCATEYYEEVTVAPAAGPCARSSDVAAPTPAAKVPWGKSAVICSYGGGIPCGRCAVGVGVPGAILAINALVCLGGLLLLRRRRR